MAHRPYTYSPWTIRISLSTFPVQAIANSQRSPDDSQKSIFLFSQI
ncbi:hypothetical protein H6F74_21405 [Trichocoleus sp. FACHB-90]|nr:hypothetical protein [Trichocoleus sp. FACHB-90]MBD1928783.1 hypothetical protein [Trichocoleus sp. FACHB-90]